MKFIAILFLFLVTINLNSQNLIMNHDFENSDDCPVNISQIYLLENWETIILDADYYNCGFITPAYPSNSLAYSGTGYVSFSSVDNRLYSNS